MRAWWGRILEIGWVALVLLCWVLLFGVGALLDSRQYAGQRLQDWLLVLLSATPTNVCLLTCLAAILGGHYRHARPDPVASLVRGFVVFLILSSGLFLLGDHPYIVSNQQKYVSLATLSSLLGFVAASDPRYLAGLIRKVTLKTLPDEPPPDK